MTMEIIEVRTRKEIKLFHELPHVIYADDKNWICQPHKIIENIFSKKHNNSLKNGSVCRWLVLKDNVVVGRIAAFVVDNYASGYEQLTGGVGFFECINSQKVANLLFDTAAKWLKHLKMEAVDGPINIGENFFNWGVLSEGFVQPTYGMQYNKPYYEQLFKSYGFRTYYEQYTYQLNIEKPDLPSRFWKIAEWIAKKPQYTYQSFSFKQVDKYINDFIAIHEQAWRKHGNYKKINSEDLYKILQESRMMIEEDFIWFVYNNGKPISFFMMVPDINQLFAKIPSGKLNLFNSLRLLWYKKQKVITRCRVLVMGVIPQFQKSGVESAIFYRVREVLLQKMWYNEMELSWVGSFNPKMISLFKEVGGVYDRTHKTMRYIFDQSKEFKTAKTIED